MGEVTTQEVAAGRRHIIRRPRLTRLLDECEARIILLVAPAGYGKTTLAREWVAAPGRSFAWAGMSPAAGDLAVLASSVAAAVSTIVPEVQESVHTRLRVAGDPHADADALAEVLIDGLANWPEEAWLVIDDYHHLKEHAHAERFVDKLLTSRRVRAIVTSRERPLWATARRLLYGEIFEVGRNLLALDQREAHMVLGATAQSRRHVQALVALADGWPAIIGLAALAGRLPDADESLPDRLYDFVAEELFATLDARVRDQVPRLALLPDRHFDLAADILGDEAADVVAEATRVGILTRSHSAGTQLHPLLRSFLDRKLEESGSETFTGTARASARALLDACLWDDAYVIIERLRDPTLLAPLIEAASDELLSSGRIATLERWLTRAADIGAAGVGVELARAEVALRRGRYDEAQLAASQASAAMPQSDDRYARALIVEGRSAYLADDYGRAARSYAEARSTASTPDTRLQAIWGQFLTAEQLEEPAAASHLADLQANAGRDADAQLRVAVARLTLAGRIGPADEGARFAERALPLLDKAKDPFFRLSFLDSAARSMILSARYEDGLELALREISEAEGHRLDFAKASAFCVRALAENGLRQYHAAHASLDRAAAMLHKHDTHQHIEIAATRTRLPLPAEVRRSSRRHCSGTHSPRGRRHVGRIHRYTHAGTRVRWRCSSG